MAWKTIISASLIPAIDFSMPSGFRDASEKS